MNLIFLTLDAENYRFQFPQTQPGFNSKKNKVKRFFASWKIINL